MLVLEDTEKINEIMERYDKENENIEEYRCNRKKRILEVLEIQQPQHVRYTLPKNDTPRYYRDQYETSYLQDGFLGIQNAAMALTSWDRINEDWRLPKM